MWKEHQVRLLTYKLNHFRHRVFTTCEPTDSPIGSIIRDIFKHRIKGDHRTIAGLFVADRLDHLLNKLNGILKKLEDGYTVICGRYYFSSYAYHFRSERWLGFIRDHIQSCSSTKMYFEAFENQKTYERILIAEGNGKPETIAQEIWNEIVKIKE